MATNTGMRGRAREEEMPKISKITRIYVYLVSSLIKGVFYIPCLIIDFLLLKRKKSLPPDPSKRKINA